MKFIEMFKNLTAQFKVNPPIKDIVKRIKAGDGFEEVVLRRYWYTLRDITTGEHFSMEVSHYDYRSRHCWGLVEYIPNIFTKREENILLKAIVTYRESTLKIAASKVDAQAKAERIEFNKKYGVDS